MKRLFTLLTLTFISISFLWAYDFSAVAPNGQTLYYRISGTNAIVTYPNFVISADEPEDAWTGFAKPTGALVIPSTVTFNNQTYMVTAIDSVAFAECMGITSVTIHDSLTSIGEGAFVHCYSITEVTIGEGVTQIGRGAFFNCRSLSRIVFNAANCTSNGAYVLEYYDSINYNFAPNTSLTEVVFGNLVQRIPGKFLSYCEGLTSITLPASVTTLGINAFFGCNNLSEIIALPIAAPQLENNALHGANNNITVHIPCGSLASYMSGWSFFNDFVEENNAPLFSVLSNDETMGEVEIITMPSCSSHVAVVRAVAHDGFSFTQWSNGATDNPYTLTLTCDTTITAFFEAVVPEQFTVTVHSNDLTMGSVTGDGTFDEGTLVTLTAIPNDGYQFMHWSNGATDNPYNLTLTCDTTITAFFEAVVPEQYTVTVHSNDLTMGSVTGDGTFDEGTLVTLTAIPNEGYQFMHWSNGATDNPYTFTLTCDTLFSAFFETIQTESIQEVNGTTIRCHNGIVSINGAEGEWISIFDITGRILIKEIAVEGKFYQIPHSGVYVVKVGNHTPQKIVIVK